MIDKDIARATRLMEDHERGVLTDVAVYGALAAVRVEATEEERARMRDRLDLVAAAYSAQGRDDIAFALSQAARAFTSSPLGAPTLADVADA